MGASTTDLTEVLATAERSATTGGPLVIVCDDQALVPGLASQLSDRGVRSEGLTPLTAPALRRSIQERFQLRQLSVVVAHRASVAAFPGARVMELLPRPVPTPGLSRYVLCRLAA